MRVISSSIMAALVVVALFWGNCLTCPQVRLSLTNHNPSHDCCKRGQKPAPGRCDSQGLQNFVKFDSGAWQHDAAPAVMAAAVPAAHSAVVAAPAPAFELPVRSLPDLLSLHSSFRI